MEFWSCAGITAAVQAPLGRVPCGERGEKKPGTKVVGKLKGVRYSMCRVMMIIIQNEENAAETKYSLW